MSSIQFNLLPDAKVSYINAQKNRKLVTTIALLASGLSIAIFIIVFLSVNVVQKKVMTDADKKVTSDIKKLQGINNIGKIMTVQNQLQTLASLHQKKSAVNRIFNYITQVTPQATNVSNLSLDLAASTIQVTGTAASQAAVNTYVDTLKYAELQSADKSGQPAFSNVVLSSFGITPGKASFSINASFDPRLFSNPLAPAPAIVVKNQVTTRSVLDDPNNALFNGQTKDKTGGQQ